MYKCLILISFLMPSCFGFCQVNGGFETNAVQECRNHCGDESHPFGENKVTGWFASHGTPQINKNDKICNSIETDVHSGTEAAFLFNDNSNLEGIFQEYSVSEDESYNISIFFKNLEITTSTKIIVKFTTGLINKKDAGKGGNLDIPVPNTQQIVLEKYLTTGNWTEFIIDEIIADNNYNQIWIYSEGTILVDDFTIRRSCCEPYKIWQNVINPPSTYVNNYIRAGENVTSSQTAGKVIINKGSNTIDFKAGRKIELLPGFETEPGANFNAIIAPCSNTLTQIDIFKISAADDPCHLQFEASACFGSGFYNFTWSNDVLDRDGSTKTKIIDNGSEWFGKKITVTVTDKLTSETVSKSIFLPTWMPFVEPFDFDNITVNNVITPNGDGKNDNWYFADMSRPNSDKFAYNSFEVEFFVKNTYGQIFCSGKKTDKINGVPDRFIFCSGDYICETKPDNMFWGARFENCKFKRDFEGVITVLCVDPPIPTTDYISDTISSSSLANVQRIDAKLNVSPNPFYNSIEIDLINETETYDYNIFSTDGKMIKKGKVSREIYKIQNLDNLYPGIYFLRINNYVYRLIKL